MKLFRVSALLLCAAALAGCEARGIQDLTGPLPSARIKFYNFSVGAPGVNFFANDAKMTAIASATGSESVVGVNYGGVASGDRYNAIQPNSYTFSARAASAADTLRGRTISSVAATIADGKSYSFYQSGIYDPATKTADAFVVEDVLPASITWSQAHVRFVHAIADADPMTLYARHTVTGQETAIGGLVAYRSGGAFVSLPPGLYDVSVRYQGSTTNVVLRTNVGFEPGRVYTIGARGDITLPSTGTSTNRPILDLTTNRQG